MQSWLRITLRWLHGHRSAVFVIIFFQILAALAFPSTTAQEPLSLGERYAIVLAGIGGEQQFTQKYLKQTRQMYDLLVNKFDYEKEHVFYLFEDPKLDPERIDLQTTAPNIRQVFRQLRQMMKAEDQLFIFMVGHGSYDGEWSKYNIVGPDLRDIDFAQLLQELPTKKIVLVNTASASGPFVDKLSGEQRVIITATRSGREYHETTFADFFLDALTAEAADVNKDRRISVLEAFQYARHRQESWYNEERRLRAEHPVLDDNGDGVGSGEIDGGKDGLWASRVYIGPLSAELEATLKKAQTGRMSERDRLRIQAFKLEQQIEDLKARKNQMRSNDYFRKLETLLVELAKVNKRLKQLEAREKE